MGAASQEMTGSCNNRSTCMVCFGMTLIVMKELCHPIGVGLIMWLQSISGRLSHCGKTKVQTDQLDASYTEMSPSMENLISRFGFLIFHDRTTWNWLYLLSSDWCRLDNVTCILSSDWCRQGGSVGIWGPRLRCMGHVPYWGSWGVSWTGPRRPAG